MSMSAVTTSPELIASLLSIGRRHLLTSVLRRLIYLWELSLRLDRELPGWHTTNLSTKPVRGQTPVDKSDVATLMKTWTTHRNIATPTTWYYHLYFHFFLTHVILLRLETTWDVAVVISLKKSSAKKSIWLRLTCGPTDSVFLRPRSPSTLPALLSHRHCPDSVWAVKDNSQWAVSIYVMDYKTMCLAFSQPRRCQRFGASTSQEVWCCWWPFRRNESR